MKIVAFGHQSEVGKDTAARLLIAQMRSRVPGIRIHRRGLADPLKAICHAAFGWAGVKPGSFYENNPGTKNQVLPALGISARQVWLDMGKYMNLIHPAVFCHLSIEKSQDHILVISDLRRKSEVEFFEGLTDSLFIPVKITAPTNVTNSLDAELADYNGWVTTIDNSAKDPRILNEALVPIADALAAEDTALLIDQLRQA